MSNGSAGLPQGASSLPRGLDESKSCLAGICLLALSACFQLVAGIYFPDSSVQPQNRVHSPVLRAPAAHVLVIIELNYDFQLWLYQRAHAFSANMYPQIELHVPLPKDHRASLL